jgi:hypothetical protein
MVPESVEIKVTISTDVNGAIDALGLASGKRWSIAFCEDVTAAVTPSTPLLDLGVILRSRKKSESKGDSTVKFRPCRWSQLDDGFAANATVGDTELKIEADWAGASRSLAAAMTSDWSDDRLDRVTDGDLPVGALFDDRQKDFLARCSRGRVNLSALTALPRFAATRWDAFPAASGGVDLSIRAERWTLQGGDDFLELSFVGTVDDAVAKQAALAGFVAARSLTAEQSQESKTQRVLDALVRAAAGTG